VERRIAPSARIAEAIEEVLLGGISGPDELSQLGRLGAQLILQRAVEDEMAAFLGRARRLGPRRGNTIDDTDALRDGGGPRPRGQGGVDPRDVPAQLPLGATSASSTG
jgi:hypothetical protein